MLLGRGWGVGGWWLGEGGGEGRGKVLCILCPVTILLDYHGRIKLKI